MRLSSRAQLFLPLSIFSHSFICSLPTAFALERHLYRFERRTPAIMDTCAYVDTDLAIIIGKDVANGAVPVQGCMCKGAIPMFIQSGQLMDIAEIVGYDFVEERLEKHVRAFVYDK